MLQGGQTREMVGWQEQDCRNIPSNTYLVHLVAEVDRVNVVSLEIREHDYLLSSSLAYT
jgi:hypothetical protein